MEKKILSIGIIYLFIGLLIIPILSADIDINDNIEQLDEDCGCNEVIGWDFPIICWILERLWYIIPQFSPYPVPLMHWVIIIIAELLGCPNIPP